jgi:hypothetical protein
MRVGDLDGSQMNSFLKQPTLILGSVFRSRSMYDTPEFS